MHAWYAASMDVPLQARVCVMISNAVAGDGPPGHCGVQRLHGWYKWLLAHGYHCKGPVSANLNGRGNRSKALQSTALQMNR